MPRSCCYLKKLVYIFAFISRRLCEVQLAHGALTCGRPAVLNCTAIPFDLITWSRNSSILSDCFPVGFCDPSRNGNMSFTVNKLSSTYTLTIDPLEYHRHQNEVFKCSDPVETKNVTLDVTVPLRTVEIYAKQPQTGVFELNAVTNCLKSTERLAFEWTCVSVHTNQNVSGICNISTLTAAVNTSSCDTGGYCTGVGLQKYINTVTVENYTGSMDTEDVNLKVTATTTDGKNVTDTYTEVFKVKRVSQVLVSGEKHVVVLIVVFACILLIAVPIALCWIKRYKPCKVSQDNSRNPDSHSQQTEDVRPNHESSDRSSRTGNENVIPLLSTSPELSEVKETFKATEHL